MDKNAEKAMDAVFSLFLKQRGPGPKPSTYRRIRCAKCGRSRKRGEPWSVQCGQCVEAARRKQVAKILEKHDLSILTDLQLDGETPCYYVGQREDLSAGIRGMSVSPNFNTKAEAEKWLRTKFD